MSGLFTALQQRPDVKRALYIKMTVKGFLKGYLIRDAVVSKTIQLKKKKKKRVSRERNRESWQFNITLDVTDSVCEQ